MSIFSSLSRALGSLPDIAWFAKLGAQLFGATFSGHDAAEDAPAVAKGISGMFGFKDERQMLVLFEKLEQYQAGAALVVNEFLNDHFSTSKPGLTISAKQYIKTQRSRFRAVVIDMGENEGEKTGKQSLTVDGKTPEGHTFKMTSEEDIRKNPKNNGLDLLLRMYTILSTAGSDDEKKSRCITYLKSAVTNVPLVNPDMVNRLNKLQDATIRKVGEVPPAVTRLAREGARMAREGGRLTAEQVHNAANTMENYTNNRIRSKSAWQRFIERF